MPIYDTGMRVDTETGVNARAKDENENVVVVSASHEAITDHGWGAIFDAASRKYDRGELQSSGPPPLVRVTTADC